MKWVEKNRALTAVLVILGLFILGALLPDHQKTTTQTQTNYVDNQEQPAAPEEKLEVKKTKLKREFGMPSLLGELTNHSDTNYEFIQLRATFYDEKEEIVGTLDGSVSDLHPGKTKTFELIGTDELGKYKKYKVDIENTY